MLVCLAPRCGRPIVSGCGVGVGRPADVRGRRRAPRAPSLAVLMRPLALDGVRLARAACHVPEEGRKEVRHVRDYILQRGDRQ